VLPVWNTGPAVLAVAPESGDVVVAAGGIDGFWASPLDDVLRSAGRDLLVLSGAGYETTVHSTLRSANDRGYECLTLTDGSAPGQPELAGAATSSICMSGGIFGAVAPSAALITTLSTKESKCLSPS
jgi:nicotinamidase-related amidase